MRNLVFLSALALCIGTSALVHADAPGEGQPGRRAPRQQQQQYPQYEQPRVNTQDDGYEDDYGSYEDQEPLPVPQQREVIRERVIVQQVEQGVCYQSCGAPIIFNVPLRCALEPIPLGYGVVDLVGINPAGGTTIITRGVIQAAIVALNQVRAQGHCRHPVKNPFGPGYL